MALQQRVCKSGPGKVDQFGGYAPSNQELFIRTICSIVLLFDVRALIMFVDCCVSRSGKVIFQIGKSGPFPDREKWPNLIGKVDVEDHDPGGREHDHEQVPHRQHLPNAKLNTNH